MNAVAERPLTDEEREDAIRSTVRAMAAAKCCERRMELFHALKELIAGRSAEAVAKMELERGIA